MIQEPSQTPTPPLENRSSISVDVGASQVLAQATITSTGTANIYTAPENGFSVIREIWVTDQSSPGTSTVNLHVIAPSASPALAVGNRLESGVVTDNGPIACNIALNPEWNFGAVSSSNDVTITLFGTEILR